MNGKRGCGRYYSKQQYQGSSLRFHQQFEKLQLPLSAGCNIARKGQVTVFIIIGIIVIAVFASIFYFTKSSVQEKFNAEGEPIIVEAPQTFKPLRTYTENCLQQVGKRGLRILGQQGGYLYPELAGEYSASNPTDADGLDLQPLKVPYWHYNQKQNKEQEIAFASLEPALHSEDDPALSIEAQLSRFVEERISECLQNYAAFEEQGFSITMPDAKDATTQVTDSSVNVILAMDLAAVKGDEQYSMDTFFVKMPLRLKQYYEIADNIRKAQQNYTFLERQGLDLIQVYSAPNAEKLPPTAGATFDLVPTVFWSTADVKEDFKGILASHVPLLRLASSDNFFRYQYPVADLSGMYQQTYDTMILPLAGAQGLETRFDYFGWEPYFDVNDKGGVIKPMSTSANYQLLHFGTQNYNTVYDVSYPVLVTIEDTDAFDGEGYSFVIALESNIRNNDVPSDAQVLPRDVSSFSSSMVCDEDKFNTQILRTLVVDSYTQEPLEAVQISFNVPEQDTCTMGLTDNDGELDSKYPAVYGGVMSFIKPEYLTDFYPIDTYKYKARRTGSETGSETSSQAELREAELEAEHQIQPSIIGYAVAQFQQPVIELHRFKTINVTLKKRTLEKCITDVAGSRCFGTGILRSESTPAYQYSPDFLSAEHQWFFSGAVAALGSSEQAIITLNRVADLDGRRKQDSFGTAVSISFEEPMQEVQLVPGMYEVTGIFTRNEEVIIPQEERCSDDIILGFGEECFTFDEVVMPSFMTGQLQWDTPATYFKITPEQLYGSSTLELYLPVMGIQSVPVQAHVRVVEDLQMMGQLSNISQLSRTMLEPGWR